MLKFLPAIILLIIALCCVGLTFTGDNTDSRALSTIFLIPAAAFALLAGIAALIAWVA